MNAWIVAAALVVAASPARAACDAKSGSDVVPLVELYTSEGCSSCPPADRWFSMLSRADTGEANFLAFHVDYWDGDGWRDRFDDKAYTRRQHDRVAHSHGDRNTVYTPQVMVDSNVRVAWDNPQRFLEALKSGTRPADASISLQLQPAGGDRWNATVEGAATTPSPKAQLWLAQYLDGQTTEVRAGENKNATLHHDHVVAKLWGPWPLVDTASQTQQVEIPSASSPWGLIAFVQDPRGRTLQTLELPASRCEAR